MTDASGAHGCDYADYGGSLPVLALGVDADADAGRKRVFRAFPRPTVPSALAARCPRRWPCHRRRRGADALWTPLKLLLACACACAAWRALVPVMCELLMVMGEPVPTEELDPLLLLQGPVASLEELERFECVAWRATRNCSEDGERLPTRDRPCRHVVAAAESGYCEFRDRVTGHRRRLMRSSCDSPAAKLAFSCLQAPEFVRYNLLAVEYEPDRELDTDSCRADLAGENGALYDANARQLLPHYALPWQGDVSMTRGVAIVVYGKQLLSVYASVRSLRALGCSLPIELWYSPAELKESHAVLETLRRDFQCFLRVIRHPRAVGYFSKTYAIAYSAFDQVLFLDADNFPVRDPTYLFDTPEFNATGAMFWPDFWRPSRTTFDVTRDSFIWELLGLDFVDMFEQESGQVMVDRARHPEALKALLHYSLSTPNLIQDLKLLWGDKDLFRMAWMRTRSKFHMIARPPGSAGPTASLPAGRPTPMDISGRTGSRQHGSDVFCGFTMVQHDPKGEIIFLHRNSVKLRWGRGRQKLWTHVQQFRAGHELRHYMPSEVIDRVTFPGLNSCWGKFDDYDAHYSVLPVGAFPFAGLEDRLLGYVREAEPLVCSWPFFCGIFY